MKEATGELNMTVITVVAIAAVGLLFTVFVWPNIQSNLALNTACSNVNSKGNYETASGVADDNGHVVCQDFTCTVTYDDKSFSKDCKQ